MTLAEYIAGLKKVMEINPEVKDSIVVFAADDEGNYFQQIKFTPSVGYWDGENFSADEDSVSSDNPVVVCVN